MSTGHVGRHLVLGFLASTLGPAALVAWLVRRWVKRLTRLLLALVLIGGAAWLGMGGFVSEALSGFSVPMD